MTSGAKRDKSGSPALNEEHMVREAVYEAARYGWYDTSAQAQQLNLLMVSVANLAPAEPLPIGASHQFYIFVNETGYVVTRYPTQGEAAARYEVVYYDHVEGQRQERELREAVLDLALWEFGGDEESAYQRDVDRLAQTQIIAALLEADSKEDDEEDEEDSRSLDYPVVHDEPPNLYFDAKMKLAAAYVRQWSVTLGYSYYCEIGLIGYNIDGTPQLDVAD